MPAKKTPSTRTAAKKTTAKKAAAKKSSPRERTPQPAAKAAASTTKAGALHSVARSIGSTLGTIAKKTSKAVEAAKQALPGSGSRESTPDNQ